MKTNQIVWLTLLILVAASRLSAAAFDSGSTGVDGALVVLSNRTLNLPADGIFNFTSVTVASNAVLTFTRNLLNTPVYLLATGDVIINGSIDASAPSRPKSGVAGSLGGPGGFNGGDGGFAPNNIAGDGLGPGAGVGSAGLGKFGTNYANSLLTPLIGGSGGAGRNGSPGVGGSGGGGAIVIASSTRVMISGAVYARGGDFIPSDLDASVFGAGSGGAIRIVAPLVSGNGVLDCLGGIFLNYVADIRRGNAGRVRIDCLDRQAFRGLTYQGVTTVSRGAQMFVLPTPLPRLDIVEAAGRAIPEGTGSLVSVELPVGSSTNQVIRIQARNFTNDVPIAVAITPENGPSRIFQAVVLQNSGNPPIAAVNVVIPPGTVNRINAWTR